METNKLDIGERVNNSTSFFRVDRRNSTSNAILTPTGEYVKCLNSERKDIEDILERYRPRHILARRNALFVFKNLWDAIKFCSKVKDSYVYEVYPTSIEGMHMADMNIVEFMHKCKCAYEKKMWGRRYWDVECAVGHPCVECLVASAKVIRKLFNQRECRSMLKSQQLMYEIIATKFLQICSD